MPTPHTAVQPAQGRRQTFCAYPAACDPPYHLHLSKFTRPLTIALYILYIYSLKKETRAPHQCHHPAGSIVSGSPSAECYAITSLTLLAVAHHQALYTHVHPVHLNLCRHLTTGCPCECLHAPCASHCKQIFATPSPLCSSATLLNCYAITEPICVCQAQRPWHPFTGH